jgi:hypothetical protein
MLANNNEYKNKMTAINYCSTLEGAFEFMLQPIPSLREASNRD